LFRMSSFGFGFGFSEFVSDFDFRISDFN